MVTKRQIQKMEREYAKKLSSGDPETLMKEENKKAGKEYMSGLTNVYVCLECGYTTKENIPLNERDTDHCCCRECQIKRSE